VLKLPARALHAKMQQRQRLKSLDAFKTAQHTVMVATDVAARGLDISMVRTDIRLYIYIYYLYIYYIYIYIYIYVYIYIERERDRERGGHTMYGPSERPSDLMSV
jgi:hypothetical protein